MRSQRSLDYEDLIAAQYEYEENQLYDREFSPVRKHQLEEERKIPGQNKMNHDPYRNIKLDGPSMEKKSYDPYRHTDPERIRT